MKKHYNLSHLLKLCLSLILTLIITNTSYAQLPVPKWGNVYRATNRSTICADKYGNTFVWGIYDTTAVFGNDTLNGTLNNSDNLYLTEYDSSGKQLWVKNYPASTGIWIRGFTPDGNGGIYIEATLAIDSLVFDKYKIKTKYQYTKRSRAVSAFIADINSKGAVSWLLPIYARNYNTGGFGQYSMGTDNSGYLYTSGYMTTDSFFIEKYGFKNYGSSGADFFALKVDSNGNIKWVKHFGGDGNDYLSTSQNTCLDYDGNFYNYIYSNSNTIYVDSQKIIRGSPINLNNIFVKIDNTGRVVFVKDTLPEISNLTCDRKGNLYFVFRNRLYNDSVCGFPIKGYMPGYRYRAYLVKCDKNFNGIWLKPLDTANKSTGIQQLLIDKNENIYMLSEDNSTVSDSFWVGGKVYKTYRHIKSSYANGNGNSFTTRMDKYGNYLWTTQIGGENLDYINSPSYLDKNANIYVSGNITSDTFQIGNKTIYFKNKANGFIAKFDTSGNLVWEMHTRGNHTNSVQGIATDNQNHVYVTGAFNSDSISFNSHLILNGHGYSYSAFVAKLADTTVSLSTNTQEIMPGNTLVIYPNPADAYITIHAQSNIQAIELIDQMGRIVKREYLAFALNTNISLSDVSAGIYLLRIQSGNQWVTKKLIKLNY